MLMTYRRATLNDCVCLQVTTVCIDVKNSLLYLQPKYVETIFLTTFVPHKKTFCLW